MGYNFIRRDNEDTCYLLPPSLKDWLPAKHLAWFVLEAVKSLDLREFYAAYRGDGWGRAAYAPDVMTALMLYAYCTGLRSSRLIEKACETDVAYRVIMGNMLPDHTTICRFRAEREEALRGLFLQVLRLCREGGLVKAGAVALDGTKMKANAALSANRDYEHLRKEIDRMFEEAKAKDEEEDRLYGKDKRGDELPEELSTPEGRRGWFKRMKARLEAEDRLKKEAEEKAAGQARKLAERKVQEEATGRKTRGRKPAEPDEAPDKEAKANTTDPESRIMKARSGFVQGYNAQAAVTEDQIIVAAAVTQDHNDVGQLKPMAGMIAENLKAAGAEGAARQLLADAGYWSEANAVADVPGEAELLIATNKDWKQRKARREAPAPRGRIPSGLSARELMERKLLTKRGRALYKLRGKTIEPTFGQIKDGRGFDRFIRRGLKANDSEWLFICATNNLLKLWRSGRAVFATGMRRIGAILRKERGVEAVVYA